MRYKGCTDILVEDRNKDLLRAYNKIVRCGGFLSFEEIYRRLQETPSSRFWITGERAYEHLVKHRGQTLRERNAMYREIERRARQYMEENGVTFRCACKAVVVQPAPSFYLTNRTMKKIIRGMIRSRGRKWRK